MILWKALSFWGRFEITYYMHESVKLCAKVSCVITRLPVLYVHYAYAMAISQVQEHYYKYVQN